MNFVESFNFYGVNAKQIPYILGEGAPTAATEGAVGCAYMDTITGKTYKCVSASGTGTTSAATYTWVPESVYFIELEVADIDLTPGTNNRFKHSYDLNEIYERICRGDLVAFRCNDLVFYFMCANFVPKTGVLSRLVFGSSCDGVRYSLSLNTSAGDNGQVSSQVIPLIDSDLRISGRAADAKAVGDAINKITKVVYYVQETESTEDERMYYPISGKPDPDIETLNAVFADNPEVEFEIRAQLLNGTVRVYRLVDYYQEDELGCGERHYVFRFASGTNAVSADHGGLYIDLQPL